MTRTEKYLLGGAALGAGLLAWLFWPKAKAAPPLFASNAAPSSATDAGQEFDFTVGTFGLELAVGESAKVFLPPSDANTTRSYDAVSRQALVQTHISGNDVIITARGPGRAEVDIVLRENSGAGITTSGMVLTVDVT